MLKILEDIMDYSKRQLIGAAQVSELLGISLSYAYKVIGQLNRELEGAGYLTINGKVDSLYLQKRFFPEQNMIQAENS